jgi:hypothetical protein
MSLVPISREEMRSLYARRIEESINRIVHQIYLDAISFASGSKQTSFCYNYQYSPEIPVFTSNSNVDLVINRLKVLFPDCTVRNMVGKSIIIDWT